MALPAAARRAALSSVPHPSALSSGELRSLCATSSSMWSFVPHLARPFASEAKGGAPPKQQAPPKAPKGGVPNQQAPQSLAPKGGAPKQLSPAHQGASNRQAFLHVSLPEVGFHGWTHYREIMPVIAQLMFTDVIDAVYEHWIDPYEAVKMSPLLCEVEATWPIREVDISATSRKYRLTEAGRILFDSLISLIVANLMRGRNVAPLITKQNLKVSVARGGFGFKNTNMEETQESEPKGAENNFLPFQAAKKVLFELLDMSLGGRGELQMSDLSEEIADFFTLLADARLVDKRRITNHSCLLSPSILMLVFQRIDSVLLEEAEAWGPSPRDRITVDNVLWELPHLDETNCYCFHDQHPFFEHWLDFGKPSPLKRKANPGPGLPWTKSLCGRTLVRIHRHAGVHLYGPARIYKPAPVLPAVNPTVLLPAAHSPVDQTVLLHVAHVLRSVNPTAQPAAASLVLPANTTVLPPAVTQYSLIDVQRLLGVKFPRYPMDTAKLFCQQKIYEKLDMASLCPDKAWFCDWTDVKET